MKNFSLTEGLEAFIMKKIFHKNGFKSKKGKNLHKQ